MADRKPKFGDWFRNPHASDDNPTRDGMYVRTVRRTGRMNRGTWYELTDGTGTFWQVRPDALQPLTSSPWRPISCGHVDLGYVMWKRGCFPPWVAYCAVTDEESGPMMLEAASAWLEERVSAEGFEIRGDQ